MNTKIFLRVLSAALCVSTAVGATSGLKLAELARIEGEASQRFTAALLQGELKGPAQALRHMSLSDGEISLAEGVMGKGYFNRLNNLRVQSKGTKGLTIFSAGEKKVNLTMLDETSWLVEVDGRQGVWTPSMDFSTDLKVITDFLNQSAQAKSWWKFNLIKEAQAFPWVTVVLCTAIVAVAYFSYRAITQASKQVTKTVNVNVTKLSKNADSITKEVNKVSKDLSKVSNEFRGYMKTNSLAASQLMDTNAAAIAKAKAQLAARDQTAKEVEVQLTH